MRLILFISLFLFASLASAAQQSAAKLLEQSKQLVVVFTPNWQSVNGKLQLYQRARPASAWVAIGNPLPVVVGRKGLGWGVELAKNKWPGPVKKEGDERSPVGVFGLGPVFGYESYPSTPIKLDYFPLTETSVCVDDEKSHYYNQVLDSSKIQKPDWSSGEQMRQVPLYNWGSVIQYNSEAAVSGAGSCIFLHIWRGIDRGTAGCVAMDETQLVKLLATLDPDQKPLVVLLSEPAYQLIKKEWDLPQLGD